MNSAIDGSVLTDRRRDCSTTAADQPLTALQNRFMQLSDAVWRIRTTRLRGRCQRLVHNRTCEYILPQHSRVWRLRLGNGASVAVEDTPERLSLSVDVVDSESVSGVVPDVVRLQEKTSVGGSEPKKSGTYGEGPEVEHHCSEEVVVVGVGVDHAAEASKVAVLEELCHAGV
jgi:hypothetical protein